MAKVYGGESNFLRHLFLKNKLVSIGVLVVLVGVVFIFSNYSKMVTGWMWLVGLLIFIFLIEFLSALIDRSASISYRVQNGLWGENIISRELERLPDEYVVFRGLKFRENCDVDCVVVGPTGVFAIEVKSHIGYIGYDGEQLTRNGRRFEKNIVSQTMNEAFDVGSFVSEKLHKKYFVKPVIVFSSSWARIRFGMEDIKGVCVTRKDSIRKYIVDKPTSVLSREEVVSLEKILNNHTYVRKKY